MRAKLITGPPLKVHDGLPGSPMGFTVAELLVALAIFSIAFGTIYKSFEHLSRSTTTENVKAGIQQGTRIAVDFLVQDIRLAGLNPMGTPGIGVLAATSDRIRFSMDTNYDGDANDPFEDITYAFDSDDGTLVQTNHLGAEVLMDSVTGVMFTYLDSDDQTTGESAEIRSVIVSLTVDRKAGRDKAVSRTYTTRVRCRNL